MSFLIDTNIWLEVALGRRHREACEAILRTIPATSLFVADLTVFSLGFYLCPRTPQVFRALISDIIRNEVTVLRLPTEDLLRVAELRERLSIDFDDAYLYRVAESFNLRIVSLDADFDRTPRGRLTPEAALAAYRASR